MSLRETILQLFAYLYSVAGGFIPPRAGKAFLTPAAAQFLGQGSYQVQIGST